MKLYVSEFSFSLSRSCLAKQQLLSWEAYKHNHIEANIDYP